MILGSESIDLYILVLIMGIGTYLLRSIYFIFDLNISANNLVKTSLESVTPSMLVALVLPYALFVDQSLSVQRIEVLALLISIPIIYWSKKFNLGLIIFLLILSIVQQFGRFTMGGY